MNAGGRLGVYGAGLVVAFGAAFGLAALVAPERPAEAGQESSEMNGHGHDEAPETAAHDDAAHGGADLKGLSLSAAGYTLSEVEAPASVSEAGTLAFRILDDHGDPVTEYVTEHDKDLHLIVVRSDGSRFQHVHPVLDVKTGVWSLPWQWTDAGSYRVYADFTAEGADGLTLTRTVEVAGSYAAIVPQSATTAQVDGYTVSLEGEIVAGSASELTLSVSRDGQPVTTLEPYLGAFGHLVALRQGDLAYLHVHPEGAEPADGETGGPDIAFVAQAPTAGRYLLYLDFQIDGQVRTAPFVVDAASAAHAH
ncbi:heavy-metal-associated domain-containing protein [Microbacterium sp. SD291]|uniref:heavy-metal-associated domain-containing protein n=1 Tax=Microbacterium sp. SD291 TaxID=2782007 RepID=UPI001A96873C|nr:heavy-metal-associated domain-containing protein [Microbacterium sp. SD291]MBO0981513.1 heavy-metal-associated domain-containing protein [Microbacterium sp. SD291]